MPLKAPNLTREVKSSAPMSLISLLTRQNGHNGTQTLKIVSAGKALILYGFGLGMLMARQVQVPKQQPRSIYGIARCQY